MSPTRTAPDRAGRTCCRGSSRADRASAAGSEEPEAATDVSRRRDAPRPVHRASESQRWRGTTCQSECASPGERACEGGGDTGNTAPGGRPGGRANILKSQAEKFKVFRIGLESEGAAKDPLTYPFKNSHQNLLDGLAKKLLTAALVKLKQRGVLV